jgi:predicted PurR-regulated permease PerM
MHKNNASTSALAIVFVASAVVFIAVLAVVIPAFEEAQAVIRIGDQVADVDGIPLAEFAADLIEQALAEIGTEAAPQQEDDGIDSVSVSSQDDTNVEEQHSTQTTTQEHVDRNENTQGSVQKQIERQ